MSGNFRWGVWPNSWMSCSNWRSWIHRWRSVRSRRRCFCRRRRRV